MSLSATCTASSHVIHEPHGITPPAQLLFVPTSESHCRSTRIVFVLKITVVVPPMLGARPLP